MKYVDVQGEMVPSLGLGTWQLTGEICEEAVTYALNNGYRHVDTAQVYRNEDRVGDGIAGSDVSRENVFLTTKVWRDNLNGNDLQESVEASLERLKTNYVDLLLVHWPFPEINVETVFREMDKLVDDGKVLNIGISNFTSKQMRDAVEKTQYQIFTNQVEYHPFLEQSDLLDTCKENGSMLTSYSPLARGKVAENKVLRGIGEKYGKTAAQVALRWNIQQDMVAAIPKASSKKHIDQNLDIFDFQLSQNEMERIHDLARSERKVDPDFAPDWH